MLLVVITDVMLRKICATGIFFKQQPLILGKKALSTEWATVQRYHSSDSYLIKETVWQFGKNAYFLSCRELDEKICGMLYITYEYVSQKTVSLAQRLERDENS